MNQVMNDQPSSVDQGKQVNDQLSLLNQQWQSVIVGQKEVCEKVLIALIANGHVLLEGVPGLAKTLIISTLAKLLGGDYKRIQFTPDMLPSDIIGTQIYNAAKQSFEPKQGPIFAQFILADEINRAPAKVQSALLECMQERQVTIGEETYVLDDPFLVLATQNPIEQEGTYPLPEAQVDRFMLKVKVGYPSREEERLILDRMADAGEVEIAQSVDIEEIKRLRSVVEMIYVDDKIKDYVVDLVQATRFSGRYGLQDMEPLVEHGASPRATIFLARAARAHAFIQRRGYVTPEDVKAVGADVLRHRIGTSYEAEAEEIDSEQIVQQLFDHIEVP